MIAANLFGFRDLCRFVFLITLFSLLFATPTVLVAGMQSPCDDPKVFPGARTNTIIVPFSYLEEPEAPLSQVGMELTKLLQFDVLFSQLKYSSIAVEYLFIPPGSDPDCGIDRVISKVMSRSEDGQGLIFFGGTLLEQTDGLYLQPEIRFLRKGINEDFSVKYAADDSSVVEWFCQLPIQQVNFAPRLLTWDELGKIRETFLKNAVLREYPDTASKIVSLTIEQPEMFSYFVAETSGDWLRIQPFNYGPAGWVKADLTGSLRELKEKLPELYFLDGVVGYINYRVAREQKLAKEASRLATRAAEAFLRFEKFADPEVDPVPFGVSLALRGMLATLESDQKQFIPPEVAELFRQVPDYISGGDARNFRALAELANCSPETPRRSCVDSSMTVLLEAFTRDPGNEYLLWNLQSVWDYRQTRWHMIAGDKLNIEYTPQTDSTFKFVLRTDRAAADFERMRKDQSKQRVTRPRLPEYRRR